MFNKNTIKDMETIDMIVSKINRKFFKEKSKMFLSWTFPTNHLHKHQILSANYFIIWCGKTGKGLLKMVCFGSINTIPKLIQDLTVIDIKNILTTKLNNHGNKRNI